VKHITVIAALHFLSKEKSVHFYSLGSSEIPPKLPPIPVSTKISDPFMSSLVHFIRISSIPTLLICLDGERVRPIRRGQKDKTLGVIFELAKCALQLPELRQKDIELSEELITNLIPKHNQEDDNAFLYI